MFRIECVPNEPSAVQEWAQPAYAASFGDFGQHIDSASFGSWQLGWFKGLHGPFDGLCQHVTPL